MTSVLVQYKIIVNQFNSHLCSNVTFLNKHIYLIFGNDNNLFDDSEMQITYITQMKQMLATLLQFCYYLCDFGQFAKNRKWNGQV